MKKEGNKVFAQKAYRLAIQYYSQAIEFNPVDHLIFSNRSASYSLLGSFVKALPDAERCIFINPDFAKGYFRKGVALKGLNRLKEALDAFNEAIKKDPDNGEYKKSIDEVQTALSTSGESSSSASTPLPSTEDLPVTLLLDSEEDCKLEQTLEGPVCSFLSGGFAFHTIFLDTAIDDESNGIFCWTIRIKYFSNDLGLNSFLELGAAPLTHCKTLANSFFGGKVADKKKKDDGSCGFYMLKEGKKLSSVLQGVENEADVPPEETPVPNDSLVAVEVDTFARTLSFFVNGTKVPRAVSGIILPLKLGTAGLAKPSFTSISFQRLASPVPSSVACTFYKVRK